MRPAYDEHADWYDGYLTGPAAEHTARTTAALVEALGPGRGPASTSAAAPAYMRRR